MDKKKKSTLFTRLFGNRNKVTDFMTEEQLQSPGRLILKNFLHNRLGMIGLIVFLLIFLLVMIGPKFYTLDLSYQDNTQLNVPPGMNMMSIPDGMKHKVADISPGTTYGVGVDTDGNVYTWGYTKITETIDLKNIPEEVQNAKIVNVAAGYDHIVALDENGGVYVWGNRRLGQDMLPDKLQMAAAYGKNLGIKQIEASNQFSAAVTEDGELFLWGNGNQADIKVKKEYQGNIEKVALTARAYIALTKDGAVVYSGFQKDNALVRIPDGLDSGVVDIAASSNAVAAVKEDGTVVVWGTCTNGEKLTAQVTAALGEGAKLEDVDAAEPFYIAADSPAIRACIDTYNEVTGENATPFTMGGGTYARHFPYAVSFGPEHEDVKLPEFGGPMHGANEAAPINKLLEAVKIYILALLRLEEIDF